MSGTPELPIWVCSATCGRVVLITNQATTKCRHPIGTLSRLAFGHAAGVALTHDAVVRNRLHRHNDTIIVPAASAADWLPGLPPGWGAAVVEGPYCRWTHCLSHAVAKATADVPISGQGSSVAWTRRCHLHCPVDHHPQEESPPDPRRGPSCFCLIKQC